MKCVESSGPETPPACIEFSIADVDRYSTGMDVRSPLAVAGRSKFSLVVYPHGTDETSGHYVSVFVEMLGDFTAKEGWSFPSVCFTITAVNNDPTKRLAFQATSDFTSDLRNRGRPDFLTYDRLKEDGWFSSAGELRFQATVSGASLWAVQREDATADRLWKQMQHTDLVISTGDGSTEMPCHRAVLAVGSPVFEAMLGSDMKEGSSGKVIVKDTSETALRRLLEYLYTGTCVDIPDMDELLELMGVADVYNMPKLQAACARELVARASLANIVQVWSMLARCAAIDEVKKQQDRLREMIHRSKLAVDIFLNEVA